MHKFFLVVLVLAALIFPNSEVFAQEACLFACPTGTSQVSSSECRAAGSSTNVPLTGTCIARKTPSNSSDLSGCVCNPDIAPVAPAPPAVAVPAAAPANPAATKPSYKCKPALNTSSNPYCTDQALPNSTDPKTCMCVYPGAADTSGATTTDLCKTDKTKCTGGSGQMCYIAPGSVDDGKPIPLGLAAPLTGKVGIYTAIGCVPTEPKALVEGLLKYGTLAAGGIAFLLMILAALQMITAEGNPESIKAGQEKFYSAIIGLLLIIFTVLLMQVIGVDILGLPGFER